MSGEPGFFQPTIRLRLTLLYGALFFIAGVLLLAGTYRLVASALPLNGLQRRIETVQRTTGDSPQLRLLETQLQERRQALREVRRQAWRSLIVVTLAAVLLGWVVAGRVLSPISRITEHAERASSEHLDERIDLRGPPDELHRLAATFDRMLDRLQTAFDAQRLFAGEVSHELRTPLAILQSAADATLADPTASDRERELSDTIRASVARSERLIDGLLTLSRSESALLERRPLDLAEIAGESLARCARAAGQAGITIEDAPLLQAPVQGDPVLIGRLCDNLLDNAIRYNLPKPGGWMRVTTHPAGELVELTVANSGPQLDPTRIEELFRPFQRGSGAAATGVPGSGLGLAIVRSVTAAHGGTVAAAAIPGGGLTITVKLPSRSEG